MTVDELLLDAYKFIHKEEARLLLSILLNYNVLELNLHLKDKVDDKIVEKFKHAVILLKQGEPLQYVLSNAPFYGYDYYVNKNVLIPRFDTEVLVDKANELIKANFDNNEVKLLDLCTGSGCIGITLKLLNDSLDVTLSDISKEALEVAEINKNKYKLDIKLIESDLFNNITDKYDVITCNPPYIGYEEEIMDLVKNNEPHLALYAKDDGLYFYKLIFEEIKSHLNDKYLLLFELNSEKSKEIYSLAKESFDSSEISIIKDLGNRDRVLIVNHN
jgi:release factor glutamine methyltransferase